MTAPSDTTPENAAPAPASAEPVAAPATISAEPALAPEAGAVEAVLLALPSPAPNIPVVAPGDVAPRVARARAAQTGWAARTVEERARIVAHARDRLLDRAAALAFGIRRETGRPEVEAMAVEVLPTAEVLQYWGRSVEDLLAGTEVEADRRAEAGKGGWMYREPRGTVALITPWASPLALPMRTIVPALLAGNAVVWKPSEAVPGVGAMVADLFAGLLPEGVFEVVQGDEAVGRALCEAEVDLVVFAGRGETGRKVAQACAARLCPCSLALGGKDAAIVLADAPLDRAANGIVWAALAGGGQTFGAIERVYVEEKVADAFIEKVKAAVAELRPGHDLSVITTEERRAEVAAQVAGAVAAGATILAGGATADRLMAPVVVKVTGDDIPLMRDPTRGPVLAIAVVADVEEAIARTNASRFGHAASIWSRNLARAERLAWRLRVGVVSINDHGRAESLPCVPWSGRGDSGYGVSGSAFALDLLTRPRFVLRAPARPRRERWWFPYTPGMRQALLARAVLGSGTSGWFRRIAALFRLAAGIFKRFRK